MVASICYKELIPAIVVGLYKRQIKHVYKTPQGAIQWLPWVSSLLTEDLRTSQTPQSRESIPYNKSPSNYMSLYPSGSVFLENPNAVIIITNTECFLYWVLVRCFMFT